MDKDRLRPLGPLELFPLFFFLSLRLLLFFLFVLGLLPFLALLGRLCVLLDHLLPHLFFGLGLLVIGYADADHFEGEAQEAAGEADEPPQREFRGEEDEEHKQGEKENESSGLAEITD
jgi:hypothetical protein